MLVQIEAGSCQPPMPASAILMASQVMQERSLRHDGSSYLFGFEVVSSACAWSGVACRQWSAGVQSKCLLLKMFQPLGSVAAVKCQYEGSAWSVAVWCEKRFREKAHHGELGAAIS